MTAPVPHADFAFALLISGEREQVAAMWRGALLQHFAFAETKSSDCIVVLRDTKRLTGSLAQLFTSWDRFARMAEVIELVEFGTQGRKTADILRQMHAYRDLRNALAHGRMTCSSTGATLSWREVRSNTAEPRVKQFSWSQMLANLQDIQKLTRDLSSLLGQIERLCRIVPSD